MQMLNRNQRRALERKDSGGTQSVVEVKKIIETMMTGFEEFKKTNDERLKSIEKKGSADPLLTAKLEKIEADFKKGDELNAQITKIEQERKKDGDLAKELRDQLDALELKLKRPGASSPEAKAELKTFHDAWCRGAITAIATGGAVAALAEAQQKAMARVAQECKALGISNDTTGGFLAPAEYVREIIKGVTEISPVRSLVRVRSTVNKSIMLPKRTGQFAAVWTADQGTRAETDGLRWGMLEVPTHEMYALVDISHQNLEDSAFDLEAEIRSECDEQFALAEGAAVVSGNAVGKPEGWMSNADVSNTVSGTAATIADSDGQANGLLTLKHAIKTAYTRNANWALNRTTLGSVRKLKDGQKNYIWMPGIALGKPNTIDGDPYVEVPDMPSEGANTYPIAYGDFMRAYTLVDRINMVALRDPYTQATSGNIRFLMYRRIGGQVILAEAIRKLKCST
ncbi:COG4653 Predicted phage phi-C31 gp36 major capsid-like protein [uncultured Caudovirales phage]|uniref:COG4653 Predicted phage phi-C31 gp36 major capsid-like protein n=3 Tax=uncultured Caudovirales phage TaxID=2100421 RepID=A0A6J5T568_9CAUD|nr:COG4653 Predicted phage phi-C31 gp36 major capsid-like protein [uncultured Caudovirales phage]CAB4222356.1 COG4653 Predicted phage phi-C31 gp36 major capsid-like protein [uncultured Caudovirales phage]